MFGEKVSLLCLCMAFVDPQQQVFRTGQGMQPADHPDF
jgi:hypothetical protein